MKQFRKTRLQGDLIILGDSPPPEDPSSLPQLPTEMALPKETLLARYAFSQALARSSALSVLETKLDSYLSSVSVLPVLLSKTGKPGLGRRELIMKLGELMIFRQGLNLNHENFLDTPDFYWAEPVLESKPLSNFEPDSRLLTYANYFTLDYFKSVTDALDMKARTRSINEKITYAAEVGADVFDLSRAHSISYLTLA